MEEVILSETFSFDRRSLRYAAGYFLSSIRRKFCKLVVNLRQLKQYCSRHLHRVAIVPILPGNWTHWHPAARLVARSSFDRRPANEPVRLELSSSFVVYKIARLRSRTVRKEHCTCSVSVCGSSRGFVVIFFSNLMVFDMIHTVFASSRPDRNRIREEEERPQ